MKRRKAPGYDKNIFRQTIIDILHKIFNSIWLQEKTPEDFSRMIVLPIHKKGDGLLRENYHAISLPSIPEKGFSTKNIEQDER